MADKKVNIDQRYLTYNKADVQRILASVDGKVFTVSEFTANQIKPVVDTQTAAALTAFRQRYTGGSIVFIPVGESYTGYVLGTVDLNGSSFKMQYFYDGKQWTITATPEDQWSVVAMQLADASEMEAATEEEVRAIVDDYSPEPEEE